VEEKQHLRHMWYTQLAISDKLREEYAKWINFPPEPLDDVRAEEKDRLPRVKQKLLDRVAQKTEQKERDFLESAQHQG